jgi:predicted permease
MAKRPGFALTVIATLALGIGASTTIFSLVDTVLLRALPYHDPSRIMTLQEIRLTAEGVRARVAPVRLQEWQRMNRTFSGMAGHYVDTYTETTGAEPEQLAAAAVSPGFFPVMNAIPALGRVFTGDEERFGGPLAAVISDRLWRRRFSADPAALGRTLALNGRSYTITGVMPAAFQYPSAAIDVFAPHQASPTLLRARDARYYDVVGRLKPGVTVEQARADLGMVQQRLGEQYPASDAGWTVVVEPLKDRLVGGVRLALWLLFGAVGLLLLIACANVACLLLAQLERRAQEMATRRALGAGRAAIARQLLTEGLVYALGGAVAGAGAAFAGVALLRSRLPDLPRISELAVDGRVLAFAVAASATAAVLFSLAPMLETVRRDIRDPLAQAGRGVAGGHQRLPRILVAAQLALATVLLVGAGLFLRTLLHLEDTPLGFQADHVLAFRISSSFSEPPPAAAARHRRTLEALSELPGVIAVGMSSVLPGTAGVQPAEFRIDGEAEIGPKKLAISRGVTSGYFETLGIPLLAGQTCQMKTELRNEYEVLINQAFASRYFAGRNPIGHTVLQGLDARARRMEVVGVTSDVREAGYASEPEPMIYICGLLRFIPDSFFMIRTAGDPAALANSVRAAMRAAEPLRAVYAVQPLTEALSKTLAQNRFRAWLVGGFAAMAMALAAIGVYGVMAYLVTQRTHEFAIRTALGAQPARILASVLRSGAILIAAGGAAGLALAAAASRLVTALLYGVRPFDLTTYIYATGVLAGVALLACWIPSRRAISIEPTEALREQ